MQVLFFISLLLVLYTYVLYPILLFIVSKKDLQLLDNNSVFVTVIIPAYNEIKTINAKIENTQKLLQHYPHKIIVVSNGSNDGTEMLQWNNVLHLNEKERKGKAAAINAAIPFVEGNFVLLTDANTLINENALPFMIANFAKPKIVMVCGEKRLQTVANTLPIEKLYWNFESNLKLLESNCNTVIGAAGECILIKKEFLKPIPENIILDDFWLSTEILKQQLIIAYENNAIATELETESLSDEYKRRIRIASGVMQWLVKYGLTSFFKFTAVTKWQFFSHRFCRWILSPIALVTAIVALINLAKYNVLYKYCLVFLIIILLISTIIHFAKKGQKYLQLPFYFIAVHICMFIGYCRYFANKHTVLWHKAKR